MKMKGALRFAVGAVLCAGPVSAADTFRSVEYISGKAGAGTKQDSGSFGRKMALGIFAAKTDEYLTIESHNAGGAEGVVFKVKKNTGTGMATKIGYWAGKAKAPATEVLQAPPAQEPPPPHR